ncbi:MAG: phytanoyl-CoA dioxygenase family protein [bacterium]|nr:phytanoyl-CoA dioxygenase family protein [bacterium]
MTDQQLSHFHRQGFFFLPNPLNDNTMTEVDLKQRSVSAQWEQTNWPEGMNRGACQFFMVGEPLFQAVEKPAILAMARRILGVDEIHVGACGLGDASKIVSSDGRLQQQVHWHVDGSPEAKQVSLRTALDRHDQSNAPLRVLPGTHLRPRDEVTEELRNVEIATGQHTEMPAVFFAKHPHEVEVVLDPRWTLVWTPSCWHATGVKTGAGLRRAMAWNYFPAGGRKRDVAALKHVVAGWENWTEERKRLWGLVEDPV